MASKQPDRITNACAPAQIGGRSFYIADFESKKKDGTIGKSNQLFVGRVNDDKTVEVVESITLTTKNIEALKLLSENLNKVVTDEAGKPTNKLVMDEDAVQDTMADSSLSGLFARLKPAKGKSLGESQRAWAKELHAFVTENKTGSVRDGAKMAKNNVTKAIAALLGQSTTATLAAVREQVMAIVTEELLTEILAMPRNDKTKLITFKAEKKAQKVERKSYTLSGRGLSK